MNTDGHEYVPSVVVTAISSFPLSRRNTECVYESNTTDTTSGAGTAYPSGAPEFIPGFSWVRIAQYL
jgi:hypothetical protein